MFGYMFTNYYNKTGVITECSPRKIYQITGNQSFYIKQVKVPFMWPAGRKYVGLKGLL